MDEPQQEHGQIIPAISFRLSKLFTSTAHFLDKVPTYVSEVVCDGTFTSIEGKLNGQQFKAFLAPAIYLGHPEQSIYLKLDLPQQNVIFYERTRGTEGPPYAINYVNRESEDRSDERRKVILVHLHATQQGRYVFDTDPEIDAKDLEKLKTIAAYLKPTLRFWKKIGKVNSIKLISAQGSGTLDDLVVPETE